MKNGSLILPSDEFEDRTLDRSDIDTPLFEEETLKTGNNGSASVQFDDGSETDIFPAQTWSLIYHTGVQKKIQEFTLPVVPGWYYMVSHDAFSSTEKRIPQATLFDAYSDGEAGQLIDTLPTTLNLNFDIPTEIDFQQYFPLESISKVEVTGLSENFWKQQTATKILFQTSREDQTMILRVTSKKGITYMYDLSLETKPAELAIIQLDTQKTLTGSISVDTTLPITIQSFINNKSWTLTAPFVSKEKSFTTSFVAVSPELSASYDNAKIFSLKRNSGILTPESGITVVPDIKVGSPLAIKTILNQKDIARVVYQANNLLFQQLASSEVLQKNTLTLVSSTLRLEPAIAGDVKLKG